MQKLPGIFYTLRKAKKFLMTVPFMFNFQSLPNNKFPTISWSLIFCISLPGLSFFFHRKRKPKIFGFENAMDRGIRKILTFVKLKIASNIFGKIWYWSPGNFEKIQVALGWPNKHKLVPIRMYFYRSKSTLYSLKSFFNAFRRKQSLGAPDKFCTCRLMES